MILQAYAAHEHRRVSRVALAEVRLDHIGREFFQLVELRQPPGPQGLLVQHRDGAGDVRQGLLALAGGHHDFLRRGGGDGPRHDAAQQGGAKTRQGAAAGREAAHSAGGRFFQKRNHSWQDLFSNIASVPVARSCIPCSRQ